MSVLTEQKGQSLVEVVIALLVTGVVLLALASAILSGMKNAQFAQNQSKATKYAQEAMEQIKTIRDRGYNVKFQNSPTCCGPQPNTTKMCQFYVPSMPGDQPGIWSCNLSSTTSSPCAVRPSGVTSGCFFKLSMDRTRLDEPANNTTLLNEDLGDGLSRQIIIEDTAAKFATEKLITVKVKWSDASGEHESNLQTILTNH